MLPIMQSSNSLMECPIQSQMNSVSGDFYSVPSCCERRAAIMTIWRTVFRTSVILVGFFTMPAVASAQAYDGWYSHYNNGYQSPWCSGSCPLSPPAPEADGFTMQAGTASEYLWGAAGPSLGFPPWAHATLYFSQPLLHSHLF